MSELFRRLFIFELANNHQGSAEHALRVIAAVGAIARKHGIRAGFKFQYRDLDRFIHPAFIHRQDTPHIPRFLSTRLTDDQFLRLVAAVHGEGMLSVCTPFDEVSVGTAVRHGVQILKVASCCADDWPLLEVVASSGKPVIMSTGGLSVGDIDRLAQFAVSRGLEHALLHCVSVYPTPAALLNLALIGRMNRRYPGVPIGYSGHEHPSDVSIVQMAVAQGATVLERHVGIATDEWQLNSYSMAPEQADAWVSAALKAWTALGRADHREATEAERTSLRSLKRGVYTARPIAEGTILTRQDVFFAMPCADGQVTSGEFGRYRAAFKASCDYRPNEPISEERRPDIVGIARDAIQEARGMLNEAGIVVGPNVEVELSHHRGLAEFRSVGAIFITVVNRDYCKKIVIVLPGQAHPSHRHQVKDETFHVLWGELDVQLGGGQSCQIRQGETIVVAPGTPHSFSSRCGAIFEEISTRMLSNDSHYDDGQIRALDPMERKTFLQSW